MKKQRSSSIVSLRNKISSRFFVSLIALVMLSLNSKAQNYQTFDATTTNALTAAKWSSSSTSNSCAAYGTSAFTIGRIAYFCTPNGTGSGAVGITLGGIIATENYTHSSPSGTLATGGTVATIDIASGKTFNLGSAGISNAAGTGFIKAGAGALLWAGNTFTGGFTLNAGTIILGGVNAMGGGATNTLTINGGTIAASATRNLSGKYANGITIGGDFALGSSTSPAVGTSNLTFTNNMALGGVTRTISIGGTGTYALNGIISNGGLTVNGTAAGIISLGGVNTYTGGTTIGTGGTVVLGAAGVLANAGAVTLNGGTFKTGATTGFYETVDVLNLTNNSTLTLGTGVHTLTFADSHTGTTWSNGKTLTITGWTPTEGKIFFGNNANGLTSQQLSQITFSGYSTSAAILLSTGELVPKIIYAKGATDYNFTTLKSAFDAINTGVLSGDIVLEVADNTTETVTAQLNAPGSIGSINSTTGSGYQPPVVTINGGTGDAASVFRVTVTNGVITNISNTTGTGWTVVPTSITIAAPTSGTTATATCSLTNGTPKQVSFTITNGGSGYGPTVSLSNEGAGSGATIDATMTAGNTTSGATPATVGLTFSLINVGRGYTTLPTMTVSSGNATVAAATIAQLYSSITIYPIVTGKTITSISTLNKDLISLNGVKYLTIDGRLHDTNGNVSNGDIRDLTIQNIYTNANVGWATISFNQNSQSNTVKYCTIKGSCANNYQVYGSIINFTASSIANGNGLNTISNNLLTNYNNVSAFNGIYSTGTAGYPNTGNQILNNEFASAGTYNYIGMDGSATSAPNTGWTITGNSFYEIANPAPLGAPSLGFNAIKVGSSGAWAGTNHTISNNYFGGGSAMCAGTATTKSSSSGNSAYRGISIYSSGGGSNTIQNNIINNIDWNNADGTAAGVSFYGITLGDGNAVIDGNRIGDATGVDLIILTSNTTTSTGGYFNGITIGATAGTIDCKNNVIGAISTNNTATTKSSDIIAITCASTGTTNIQNNVIGSATTANSINAKCISSATLQSVQGIVYSGTNANTQIINNTIANLTNGTTNTATGTQSVCQGILVSGAIIRNNTIHDITNGSANTALPIGSVSAAGIVVSSTGTLNSTITGNTIYNISNSFTDYTGGVSGIHLYRNGAIIPTNTVSGNLIYGLSINSPASGASIDGIYFGQGINTLSNNIISLGGNTKTQIAGIYEASLDNTNLYNNSIYIGGTSPDGATGSNSSYCIFSNSETNTRQILNNLLYNNRTNTGTNTSQHRALYFNTTAGTGILTCNYNNLYTTLGVKLVGAANLTPNNYDDLATWKAATAAQDANSASINPEFSNASGNLNLSTDFKPAYSASLSGLSGTGVTTDFNAVTRESVPVMGALEAFNNIGSVTVTGTKNLTDLGAIIGANLTLSDNSKLTVGSPVTVNNVTFEAGKLTTSSAKVDAALTVSGTVKLNKTLDNSKWYFMSFPCTVVVDAITKVSGTGTLGALGTNWWIKYYDGESRIQNLGLSSNWKFITAGATLEANKGYIIALGSSLTGDQVLSIPLNKTLLQSAESARTVGVTNWGEADAIGANHKGWNLVGVPYLSQFTGSNIGAGYLTFHNGTTYTQTANTGVSSVNPFSAFFVQASTEGTTALLSFALEGRQPVPGSVTLNPTDRVKLVLTSATGEDRTNLVLNDAQSTEYQINQDLEKWLTTGTDVPQVYTSLGGINYAYNALPASSVVDLPLSFYTKTAGTCTISADAAQAPGLTSLYLTDNSNGVITDLLKSAYDFNADSGTSTARFTISMYKIATGDYHFMNADGAPKLQYVDGKILLSNISGETTVRVFDAIGQTIISKKVSTSSIEIPLSTTGIFIINIHSGEKQWSSKLINK